MVLNTFSPQNPWWWEVSQGKLPRGKNLNESSLSWKMSQEIVLEMWGPETGKGCSQQRKCYHTSYHCVTQNPSHWKLGGQGQIEASEFFHLSCKGVGIFTHQFLQSLVEGCFQVTFTCSISSLLGTEQAPNTEKSFQPKGFETGS